MAPTATRLAAWKKLAHDLDPKKLDRITQEITLAQALSKAPEILAGKVRGRLVVNVNA
jgi:acrylyl-CoA reductase (NADPH)